MPFVTDHPVIAAGFAGSTAIAGGSAIREFKKDRRDPIDERLGKTGMAGVRGGFGGVALTAAGYGLYKASDSVKSSAAPFFRNQFNSIMDQSRSDSYALSTLISRGPEHEEFLHSYGLQPMSRAEIALQSYGRNGKFMVGGGIAAGLLVGAAYGSPALGAGIGAVGGFAMKAGLGVASAWKRAGKVPGLRTLGVLAASTMIFAGAQALSPAEFQGEGFASNDGSGSYDYSEESPIKSRMASMNATGNLVLGLNRNRHG